MRDHREIIVAGEARSVRPAGSAPRRAAPRPKEEPTEWRMLAGACLAATIRACRGNPGSLLGSLAVLGAVAVICVNALGSQAGRHPAPILPKVAIRQDAVPVKAAPKPTEAEAPRPAVRTVESKPSEAAKPTARDPIGEMIRSEDTTASVTPKPGIPKPGISKPGISKPERTVMQAQRALEKLGYGPLKPDGVMGSGTHAAIEKFERDRKLPVKGEAAGRTLRELVARAGLPPG
ncbi:peptidoglycan-binding domain-containing protein [Methylobacterium trifolii]|uniref:Peptidoglycan binding-like domain-containing protein n=1 Tax=Methylobacterium trifolii TaxID=1003092 RepID=A0ABQ4U0A4_9HYPH|nr:peptidoglycan-binding domain-containing protein [Methylobacterium trifolii]GJE60913.1 hypothetical protein MPOCJGCO_3032 [Methylobacterium trifolii]